MLYYSLILKFDRDMSQPDLDFPLGSETPSLDDSIISDVPLLKIDMEQIFESDVERYFRVVKGWSV